MRRRRYATEFLLAPAVLALVLGAVGCTSKAPEEALLRRFFAASKLGDSATLGSIAMVSFGKAGEGIVERFRVVSVSEERSTRLHLRELSAALRTGGQPEKAVSAAREQLAAERELAFRSVHQGLARAADDPIDVTAYDGTAFSKDYTIEATIVRESKQRVTKTLVVTLQRVVLVASPDTPDRDRKAAFHAQADGKWMITKIRVATSGAGS